MNCVGGFSIEHVTPDFNIGGASVGILFDDYPLFDFMDGWLWLWKNLPRSTNLDIDISTRTLIIISIDDMGVNNVC